MFKDIDIMLNKAYQQKYAVPQFNVNNLEWAKHILEASQNLSSPVVLAISESAIEHIGGYQTAANMIKGLIDDLEISIPVGLMLDHGSNPESVRRAIDAGFNGVMISNQDFNEYLKMVSEILPIIREKGIYFECESGYIGDEENSSVITNPEQAIALMRETNADALAPSLGNKHGVYHEEVEIDFNKLILINNNINKPIVLHGGSGIPDHMIIKAIESGVAKVNINTDLKIAWSNSLKKLILDSHKVTNIFELMDSGKDAMQEVIATKIMLLGSNYKG